MRSISLLYVVSLVPCFLMAEPLLAAGAKGASPLLSQPKAARYTLPTTQTLAGNKMFISHPDGSQAFLGTFKKPLPQWLATSATDEAQRATWLSRQFFLETLQAPQLELLRAPGHRHTADAATLAITPDADPASPDELETDAPQQVIFQQSKDGIAIEGTYALAQLHHGMITYARHRLVQPPKFLSTTPTLRPDDAARVALRHAQSQAEQAQLRPQSVPALRIVYVNDAPRLAFLVEVQLMRPWEARSTFVDAHTGEWLREKKTSYEAVSGHLSFRVEPQCNGDAPRLRSMPHTLWQKGAAQFTDERGNFSSSAGAEHASVDLQSPYVTLKNRGGKRAGPWEYPLAAAPADNDIEISEAPLDQIDPYFHVHTVRNWVIKTAGEHTDQLAWANDNLRLNVNIPDSCNAYYDGSLNFFSAGDGCFNTGRTAGVVYHEYAHGIHEHSPAASAGLLMDGQVSEGIADYVAATLTGNPNMRGLFACDDNFRSCENNLTFCEDDCDMSDDAEVHDAGQVICAVWWEYRGYLAKRYGNKRGIKKADRHFLRFLTLVGDMHSAYQAAIASDEDPDHDPTNGTVHSCEINRAFANKKKGAVAHFPQLTGRVPCHPAK
jgi:hypothetical protein